MMMHAPDPQENRIPQELQSFVYVTPEVGDVLLWESWLRHEVPMNMAEGTTGSLFVSFNYGLGVSHAIDAMKASVTTRLVVRRGLADLQALRMNGFIHGMEIPRCPTLSGQTMRFGGLTCRFGFCGRVFSG